MPSYETTAVVFLDVLGTQARRTFDEKFSVHRLFHLEMKQHEARQKELPNVIYTRELRSFSDCVYIFYRYKTDIEESRKNDLNLIYTCLFNTSITLLWILNAGFLVRGGATLDNCFIDELGFFGPAVEEAYRLEHKNKRLRYPRINISDNLGSRLFECEQNLERGEFLDSVFTGIPKLILRDDNGFFLNVFYPLEISNSLQYNDQILELRGLKDHVSKMAISAQIKFADDEDTKEKYQWMKAFADRSEIKLNPDVVSGTWSNVIDS